MGGTRRSLADSISFISFTLLHHGLRVLLFSRVIFGLARRGWAKGVGGCAGSICMPGCVMLESGGGLLGLGLITRWWVDS